MEEAGTSKLDKMPQGEPAPAFFGDGVRRYPETRRMSDLPRLAYRVDEVAKMLGISEKSVRRLIARGLLKPSKVLRHLLIPHQQVEGLLKGVTR